MKRVIEYLIPRNLLMMSLLLVCLPQVSLTAQADNQSLEERTSQQLDFVWQYLRQHKAQEPFASTAEIDTLMAELTAAWKNHIGDEDPVLTQLGSHVYTYILIYFSPDGRIDMRAIGHVWANYMLTPFFEEFEYFKEAPTASKAYMVNRAQNIYAMAIDISIPDKNNWVRLKSIYDEMPGIIDKYIMAGAYARPDVKERLESHKSELLQQKPVWEIRDLIYSNRHDEAFDSLAAALMKQETPPQYLVVPAKELADYYGEAGQAERAFAVLDMLTVSTNEVDLAQDSLRAWYAAVDPERGPERFKTAGGQRGLAYVSSGKRIELRGRYTDLTSGNVLELADLKGKTVLLDFWTTWCGPCIAEIPDLIEFAERYGTRDDFVFVSVCSDAPTGSGQSEAQVRAFVEQKGINYIVLYDRVSDPLSRRLEVLSYPSKFLIGPEGEYLVRPFFEEQLRVFMPMVETYLASSE